MPTITRGDDGLNKYWDFSSFTEGYRSTMSFKPASSHPNAIDFPTADYVIESYLGVSFLDLSDNKFEIIGSADDYEGTGTSMQSVHFDNNETLNSYPSSLDSIYSDSSKYSFVVPLDFPIGSGYNIDSVRINSETQKWVVYDATGTVNTPQGVYANALRENAMIITNDYNQYCVSQAGSACQWYEGTDLGELPAFDTIVKYSWYNADCSRAFASITYDYGTDTVRSANISYSQTGSGIAENMDNLISIYPNPASEKLNITGVDSISSVTILDNLGRVALYVTQLDSFQLTLDKLPVGAYTIKITTAGAVFSRPLSIVR